MSVVLVRDTVSELPRVGGWFVVESNGVVVGSARGGSAADWVGKVVRVVDAGVRALRRAAVDRSSAVDRAGDLTGEHVRLIARRDGRRCRANGVAVGAGPP